MVAKAGNYLKICGATGIVLCANTTHLIADRLEREINLPVIHIATATANEIVKCNIQKVGLLGSKFTMELEFFKSKLSDRGIEILIPDDEDRRFIHTTIYNELDKGIIKDGTKKKYLSIIDKLIENGAEGIVLGCTEIPLMVQSIDVKVPIFDTTLIHSKAAIEFALR